MARSDSDRPLYFESLEARRSLTANIAAPLAAAVASAEAASLSAEAAEVRAFEEIELRETVSNREILRHVQTLEAIDVEKALPNTSAGEATDRWLLKNSPTSVLRSSNDAWK